MSNSRAINKSYYGAMETGGKRDIEMPPLEETPPVQSAQNPWDKGTNVQAQQNTPFPVPESLPEDVEQALSSSSDQQIEEVQEDENISDRNESDQDGSAEEPIKEVKSDSLSPAKESFKSIREAKEKAERERDSYMRHALELEMKYKQQEEQQRKQVAIAAEEPEVDFNIDEDALVDGKHLRAVASKIKKLESQLEQRSIEDRIRNQFPDFEKVVSAENVKKLNEQFPEIAQMLRDTGDIMSKASAAYSVIKKFGIHKDVYEADKQKAIANASKPRPLASVNPQQGDSPLSKANAFANGLTPELQEQLRREMFESRRN
jgi:hypothetical protein